MHNSVTNRYTFSVGDLFFYRRISIYFIRVLPVLYLTEITKEYQTQRGIVLRSNLQRLPTNGLSYKFSISCLATATVFTFRSEKWFFFIKITLFVDITKRAKGINVHKNITQQDGTIFCLSKYRKREPITIIDISGISGTNVSNRVSRRRDRANCHIIRDLMFGD